MKNVVWGEGKEEEEEVQREGEGRGGGENEKRTEENWRVNKNGIKSKKKRRE